MSTGPMRIDPETRAYVRVALRDTILTYDMADLLDLMAEVCQQNADVSRTEARLGLTADDWQRRADVLREAAENLPEEEPPA